MRIKLFIAALIHLLIVLATYAFMGLSPLNRIGFALLMSILPIIPAVWARHWLNPVAVYIGAAIVIRVSWFVLHG